MENYANIGKLVLKNAIGLQKNRKQISYETSYELDEKASGCFACPNHSLKQVYSSHPEHDQYKAACSACEKCPYRQYVEVCKEKVTYLNEHNRFGSKLYSATLKTFGIKLLLVLHMMAPNRHGHLFNLNVNELKDIIGCDRKTVLAQLKHLSEYGYIEYVSSKERGFYNVIINGYDDYYKPANKGGRGYLTLSEELVMSLIDIKDLTTLRIFIQQLIEADDHSVTDKKVFNKTFNQSKDYLPDYYRPNHIRKGLEKNISNPIFDVHINDTVTFVLNEAYNAKKIKQGVIVKSIHFFESYFTYLNESFTKINAKTALPEDLLNAIILEKNIDYYVPYQVDARVIKELAKLSWQISLYDIVDAIDYIYCNYIINFKEIDNFPGLVRVLVEQLRDQRNVANLAA